MWLPLIVVRWCPQLHQCGNCIGNSTHASNPSAPRLPARAIAPAILAIAGLPTLWLTCSPCCWLADCWLAGLVGLQFFGFVADLLVVDVRSLQVRGEASDPWRQPRLRMPRRSGSRLKRVRSPPRHRGSEISDRGREETATDVEMLEQRSKHRQGTRYASRVTKEREAGRTPPKRKRRVVAISTEEEEEDPNQLSPRGDNLELQHDFK